MKKLFLRCGIAAMLVLFTSFAYSQYMYKVDGFVYDYETGEPMFGATVQILSVATAGTLTNDAGYYRIPGNFAGKKMRVSYIGYQVVDTTITSSNQTINIRLKEDVDIE